MEYSQPIVCRSIPHRDYNRSIASAASEGASVSKNSVSASIGGSQAACPSWCWSCIALFFALKTALERIGSALAMAGGINAIVQFLRRPARTMPDSAAIIRFYRSELERLRDFHLGKGIFSWLLPFLPGPIVWAIGFALCVRYLHRFIKLEMVAFLQRRIDALDASQRQWIAQARGMAPPKPIGPVCRPIGTTGSRDKMIWQGFATGGYR